MMPETMPTPSSIRLFLVHGDPGGLRTAEIGLSTCKAVACPRASLAALRQRPEAARTGVYVLLGELDGATHLYVGEGDEVLSRIARHDNTKDFWDRLVFFVSKDENLTKAHVRYLEARLLELATAAKRARLTNGTAPAPGGLPEADRAEMELFLSHIRVLLGVLGVSAFEAPALRASAGPTTPEPPARDLPHFYLTSRDLRAEALLDGTDFVVLRGSHARKPKASFADYYAALRRELVSTGVLVTRDGKDVFAVDHVFSSPSAAAQIVLGISANGRIHWKLADGTTLKDWQESLLADAASS